MEPKLGDLMKVNPSLTGLTDWIEGQVIDVEHNPFMGLVISIKDNLGRIFFGQSKYFVFKGDCAEGKTAVEYADELRSTCSFTRKVETW